MSDNFEHNDDQDVPGEEEPQEEDIFSPKDEESVPETPRPQSDPLIELRHKLFSEEQSPQIPSKPDLLRRMTGGLNPKKAGTRGKDYDTFDSGFGVRTTGGTDYPRRNPVQDRIPPVEKSGSAPLPPSSPPTKRWQAADMLDPFENQSDNEEQNQSIIAPPTISATPVEIPSHKKLDPLWDGATEDEDQESANPETKPAELLSRTTDERKRLPSGFERQQQVSRYISYNPKKTLWEKITGLSRVEKILGLLLGLAILVVGGLILVLYLNSRQPGLIGENLFSPAQSTPVPSGAPPIPASIKFPGGWTFKLATGAMDNGKWAPTHSEWLLGTEVRKIVAIPWNKQIEAVVRTFEINDTIQIEMNNNDVLSYKVQSIGSIPVSDTSILYDSKPSLVVILIDPNSEYRIVVVATP